MKRNKMALALVAAIAVSGFASAAEFSTDCVPGYALRKNADGAVQTPITVNGHWSAIYIGNVNTFCGSVFLWAGMPSGVCTNATIVMPITGVGGTLGNANMDIWSMGYMTQVPGADDMKSSPYYSWITYDDTTPTMELSGGTYQWLNGHAPVKILDNAVASNKQVNNNATLRFKVPKLITEIGMAFNRGATTDSCAVFRFNTDSGVLPVSGGFRPYGYSTADKEADSAHKAIYVEFAAHDDEVAAPASHLTAEERASDWYVTRKVDWVQYRGSDGTSGFSYPAYCGVKDGVAYDLLFTFDAPECTLTNAWLALNALPPLTGTVPAGAKVSLSLLGFVDAPAYGEDLLITDAMLGGQTPVQLQDNVVAGGVTNGKMLFTDGVGQRDLIRALNARAKAAALANDGSRSGKKAVMRLSVTSPVGADDWGFSIGSVATPGVESFFECIEYRKWTRLFLNMDFESGFAHWGNVRSSFTAEQLDVVEDPTDSSNHCLRFCNTGLAATTYSIQQSYAGATGFIESLRGQPYRTFARVYMPSSAPFTSVGGSITEFGRFILYNAYSQPTRIIEKRIVDYATPTDKWTTISMGKGVFDNVIASEMRAYFYFTIGARDLDDGATAYIDDVVVEVENFYEYPKEREGMTLIFK